jgi:hypothetical protein
MNLNIRNQLVNRDRQGSGQRTRESILEECTTILPLVYECWSLKIIDQKCVGRRVYTKKQRADE